MRKRTYLQDDGCYDTVVAFGSVFQKELHHILLPGYEDSTLRSCEPSTLDFSLTRPAGIYWAPCICSTCCCRNTKHRKLQLIRTSFWLAWGSLSQYESANYGKAVKEVYLGGQDVEEECTVAAKDKGGSLLRLGLHRVLCTD